MSLQVKQFLLWVVCVWVATAGPLFIANAAGNVFTVSWATWEIIISGGIFGLVSAAIAWALPQVKAFGIGAEVTADKK